MQLLEKIIISGKDFGDLNSLLASRVVDDLANVYKQKSTNFQQQPRQTHRTPLARTKKANFKELGTSHELTLQDEATGLDILSQAQAPALDSCLRAKVHHWMDAHQAPTLKASTFAGAAREKCLFWQRSGCSRLHTSSQHSIMRRRLRQSSPQL